MAAQSAAAAKQSGGFNWRRLIFYVIEVVYAIIAGTGEAYMYAAYNAPGSLRWWEAIARAVITQFALIFFGVAGIEAMRWHGAARVWGMIGSWTATVVASVITFWFLLDAARVFRDSAMLAPLNNAAIPLPWGGAIPNATIDIVVVAALPFFQLGLNFLAPLITADHAPMSLEEQQHAQALALAKAKFDAEMAQYQGVGFGARLGGVWKGAKQVVVGEQTSGAETEEPADNVTQFPQASSADSSGFGARAANSGTGNKGAGSTLRKNQWTSTNLREYALRTYGVNVSPDAAQTAMSALANMGKATKIGNRYVASDKTVMAWVDAKYGNDLAAASSNR